MNNRTNATRRPNTAEAWATGGQAPLWVSVALFAVARADAVGVAWLRPGELRKTVAPMASKSSVSQAITRAVQAGWLVEGSTTYRLEVRRG